MNSCYLPLLITTMNRILTFVVLIVLFACSKKSGINYPAPPPTDQLMSFLPGLINTDSLELNAVFSPDGKSFYFSRYDIHDIYESKYDGNQWTTPVITSFSEKEFQECDGTFSPDGKRFYYISTRKKDDADTTKDFNIWFVDQLKDGWSEPQNLFIVNSDSDEFYVSFADNGNLYFASNREGGLGSYDIYVSKFENNEYTAPVNLGEAVNNDHFEHDPFISPDESFIIYTSVGREGGLGKGDLYYSIKDKENKWSAAKNLGPVFNTAGYEYCPSLTRDKKYFFLTAGNDIKWIGAESLFKVINQ